MDCSYAEGPGPSGSDINGSGTARPHHRGRPAVRKAGSRRRDCLKESIEMGRHSQSQGGARLCEHLASTRAPARRPCRWPSSWRTPSGTSTSSRADGSTPPPPPGALLREVHRQRRDPARAGTHDAGPGGPPGHGPGVRDPLRRVRGHPIGAPPGEVRGAPRLTLRPPGRWTCKNISSRTMCFARIRC